VYYDAMHQESVGTVGNRYKRWSGEEINIKVGKGKGYKMSELICNFSILGFKFLQFMLI
jgi:hypothetical protein